MFVYKGILVLSNVFVPLTQELWHFYHINMSQCSVFLILLWNIKITTEKLFIYFLPGDLPHLRF